MIQLTCSVQSTSGPLSVAWQWTDTQATEAPLQLASIDRDGTVWHSPSYRERSSYGEVRAEKARADTFSLSLYNALPGDEGQYRCQVTEWLQTGAGPEASWEKIGEKSATKTITVRTVGKLVQHGCVNEHMQTHTYSHTTWSHVESSAFAAPVIDARTHVCGLVKRIRIGNAAVVCFHSLWVSSVSRVKLNILGTG